MFWSSLMIEPVRELYSQTVDFSSKLRLDRVVDTMTTAALQKPLCHHLCPRRESKNMREILEAHFPLPLPRLVVFAAAALLQENIRRLDATVAPSIPNIAKLYFHSLYDTYRSIEHDYNFILLDFRKYDSSFVNINPSDDIVVSVGVTLQFPHKA